MEVFFKNGHVLLMDVSFNCRNWQNGRQRSDWQMERKWWESRDWDLVRVVAKRSFDFPEVSLFLIFVLLRDTNLAFDCGDRGYSKMLLNHYMYKIFNYHSVVSS
jgi:hypothetical protein